MYQSCHEIDTAQGGFYDGPRETVDSLWSSGLADIPVTTLKFPLRSGEGEVMTFRPLRGPAPMNETKRFGPICRMWKRFDAVLSADVVEVLVYVGLLALGAVAVWRGSSSGEVEDDVRHGYETMRWGIWPAVAVSIPLLMCAWWYKRRPTARRAAAVKGVEQVRGGLVWVVTLFLGAYLLDGSAKTATCIGALILLACAGLIAKPELRDIARREIVGDFGERLEGLESRIGDTSLADLGTRVEALQREAESTSLSAVATRIETLEGRVKDLDKPWWRRW